MSTIWLKRTGLAGAGLLAAAAVLWLAWPAPVGVDLATVRRGAMEVTVDDDGKTQVRHVYTVSAPIVGKVLRISHPSGESGVSIHVGDQVVANESVVAMMQPSTPSFIDVRSRQELQATVAAADAAVKLAEAEVRRIEAALEFSRTDLRRAEALAKSESISAKTLDKARLDFETNSAALASAKAQLDVRRGERASISARLMEPSSIAPELNSACCIQIRAPVTGRVLRVAQESEAVVQSGAPLVEIGDPLDLEVEADLLSSDAVQIEVGAPVRIDGWGGRPIQGRVKRVDPAGFLKVSALGIEEQRVQTIIDFVDPPEAWSRLGHDFRVIVHVTIWNSDHALTVPIGALFRKGEDWAVFKIRDGRARTTLVQVGRRNNRQAEITDGVSAGDLVVLHPSDRITEGIRIARREER